MPEHVHLLIGEPKSGEISTFLKTVKQRSSRTAHKLGITPGDVPVWQRRYYDFNVFTEKKRVEKLKYEQTDSTYSLAQKHLLALNGGAAGSGSAKAASAASASSTK